MPSMSNRTHADLIYAAYTRCPCGAGLAHLVDVTKDTQYWDCSAILLGTADKAVQHTGQLPFAFYDVKSEQQISVAGATTRPPGASPARKPTPMTFKPTEEKIKVLIDTLFKAAPDRFQRCTFDGRPANMLVTDSRPYDKEKDGDNNPPMTTWWLFDDGTIEYATDCKVVSHAIDFGGASKTVIVEDAKIQFDQAVPVKVSDPE
jgi:hypothetical protein